MCVPIEANRGGEGVYDGNNIYHGTTSVYVEMVVAGGCVEVFCCGHTVDIYCLPQRVALLHNCVKNWIIAVSTFFIASLRYTLAKNSTTDVAMSMARLAMAGRLWPRQRYSNERPIMRMLML